MSDIHVVLARVAPKNNLSPDPLGQRGVTLAESHIVCNILPDVIALAICWSLPHQHKHKNQNRYATPLFINIVSSCLRVLKMSELFMDRCSGTISQMATLKASDEGLQ